MPRIEFYDHEGKTLPPETQGHDIQVKGYAIFEEGVRYQSGIRPVERRIVRGPDGKPIPYRSTSPDKFAQSLEWATQYVKDPAGAMQKKEIERLSDTIARVESQLHYVLSTRSYGAVSDTLVNADRSEKFSHLEEEFQKLKNSLSNLRYACFSLGAGFVVLSVSCFLRWNL